MLTRDQWALTAAGVLLLALSPWLKHWAHDVNDPARHAGAEALAAAGVGSDVG